VKDKRIDLIIVEQGLVKSRTEARRAIDAGLVNVVINDVSKNIHKASEKFPSLATPYKITIGESDELKYVSRAGVKLEAALLKASIDVSKNVVLDVGQSTGGFTDCLLRFGASHVIGIEVGRGQLDARLVADGRVSTLEGYNARHLALEDLPDCAKSGVNGVVMDVSFISQHLILPKLPAVMQSGGWLMSLVKPQFEAGREWVGKNGVVRDTACYKSIKTKIKKHLGELGFCVECYMESPIQGGDGNREFLVVARKVTQ